MNFARRGKAHELDLTVDQFGFENTFRERPVSPHADRFRSGYNLNRAEIDSFYMIEAERLVDGFQSQMQKLIKDEISLPSWKPTFNSPDLKIPQDHKEFIHNLKIPLARAPHHNLPDMLLYELGRFQQDKRLEARIQALFTAEPYHKIFVNTSGAGKTRLVLEHLCSSWGLYFSCHDSSHVGSKDLPSAMSNIRQSLDQSILPHAPNLLVTSADIAAHARDKGIPHRDITEADVLTNRIANFKKDVPKSDQFRQALQKNQQVAESELVVPLLARLLVFQRYITTLSNMGENLHQMDHKRRWLHLQLHPHLLNSNGSGEGDLFDQISGDLNALFERQNLHLSQKIVIMRRLSKEILDCVRKTLGLDQEAMPIYFVIDECQFSVTDMEDLFRSADWTTKRGILRELARSWDKTLNRASGLGIVSSAFIFTGTGLSRELISDVISSVVVKTQFLTSVYDTGAFDDPETQAAYLERFFPSDIWKNSGLLGDRIYYWLRGRHRFTAEYMSLVLQCGYQNMHQLLDQYIRSLACFQPADCASPEKNFFGIVTLPGPAFGFENLNARMREKVKTIAHEYLFTSKLETRLGSDERAYIELGLARISGYDGKISIKIDESLVLLSCAVWFNEQRAHTVYKTLADRIDTHNPFTGRNGFEEFISYYLLQVFQNPIKLNEVFDFESREHNGLGDREAQLVTLHLDGNQRLMESKVSLERGDSTLFGPIGLGIGTRDHSLLNEWLSLRRRETFCFPMNFMGPDIMCFLKLEGEGGDFSYICLAIQCKFRRSESLEPKTLRGAIATVTPRGFFQGDSSSDRVTRRENVLNTLQNHSHRCLSAGEYGIIRIICGFPVEVRLDKAFPQAQATPTIDSAKRQRITTQDPDEGDNHPLGKLRTSLLISTTENEHPKDILSVIMQCADDARNKGLGYWDENDPAVLAINRRCEGASSNGTAIDEFAPSSLRAGSKRKYN